MAKKPTIADKAKINLQRTKNFLGFARAYFKKNNPLKKLVEQVVSSYNWVISIKKTLKKYEYRINYERYKLKKTELILAQNSEHVFLRGRSINQLR